MQGYSVLLSNDPQGFGRDLAAWLAGDPAIFSRVELASDAGEMERRMAQDQPHMLVLDLALSGLGGPAGAQRLAQRWRREAAARGDAGVEPVRRLVVVSPLGDDALVSQVFAWGADYFVVRPFDLETMTARLRQILTGARPRPRPGCSRRRKELESRVIRHLEELGVPPHYKGRAYLVDAIAMVVEQRDLLGRVTKELYPRVAGIHRTSAPKVERSIRHAIESTVQRGNLERVGELFADLMDEQRTRPTNSAFIARMAERIRAEISR